MNYQGAVWKERGVEPFQFESTPPPFAIVQLGAPPRRGVTFQNGLHSQVFSIHFAKRPRSFPFGLGRFFVPDSRGKRRFPTRPNGVEALPTFAKENPVPFV